MLSSTLALLGAWLKGNGYHFATVTPATHARIHARPPAASGATLRDIFGWSRPFQADALPAAVLGWLGDAHLLETNGTQLRSRVRFSTLSEQLYAHSAYPTTSADAVFFGPDSYRFAALIEAELERLPLMQAARILDIGCGAGPGGISAAWAAQAATPELTLADINSQALDFARANVQLAGLAHCSAVRYAISDLYGALPGNFDLIVANPPYLVDAAARTYRHGGGAFGGALSERIVREGLPRLAAGGRLVLYTGSAIVDGADPFLGAVQPLLQQSGWPFHYRELDPDVFGEELDTCAYARAERIAAIALTVQRPRAS